MAALASRNAPIADFWLRGASERQQLQADLSGREVLIVDAEDTFTSMIAKQLKSLGLTVTVRGFQEPYSFDGYDLVIMGPGPGNPTEIGQPKIGHLHLAIRSLLSERRPFLAVCLSHQVLSLCLGLDLQRRQEPNQGVQKQIDLFGAAERRLLTPSPRAPAGPHRDPRGRPDRDQPRPRDRRGPPCAGRASPPCNSTPNRC